MRWDSLRLDGGPPDEGNGGGLDGGRHRAARPAPALFERDAVARTFETPEFRGMTFYEVRAKSIINQVPPASRMAFRWTINPYRGCSHACAYCIWGGTPILMADGRTKPLADVRPGDAIYGTIRRGAYRHYVITDVLAHWRTVKPAYMVTLEDGSRLFASGDHRFLTSRGWKHVTGTEQGAARRPHLTLTSKLMGTGAFAEPPKKSPDYQHGYQAGTGGGRLRRWPASPSLDWRKGFLAGVFDAEGSYSLGVWQVTNTDPEIIGWTFSSMKALGFDVTVEDVHRPDRLQAVRLRGGLGEALRFFHATDPAITRKRSIDGMAIKSDASLRVACVEPMGTDLEMFDITTGTGDFIANGVVSHNCFARSTHTYLDLDSGQDFNSKIVVKVNAPELARRELAAPGWRGEHVAMGTNVDCYQRAEGRYRLMPGIIAALRDAANPFSILTKGTLILRDLDLLEQAAEVTDVGLNVSVGFTDRELSRSVEPGTPAPQRRLAVCAALTARGLRCGVLMGPVLPYLTDSPAQLEATVKLIAEAGAAGVTPIVLHLRPGAREWYLRWLRENFPGLAERYECLYRSGAYAPRAYQQQIAAQVSELARRYGVGQSSPRRSRAASPARRGLPPRPAAAQPAASGAVQLSLL